MTEKLNVQRVARAMGELGLTKSALATKLGVRPPSVTYWLQGLNNPKPHTLLRLAFALNLTFDEIMTSSAAVEQQPIVAYRAVKNRKTSDTHFEDARELGRLLRPVSSYLPNREVSPAQFIGPEATSDYVQRVALEVRRQLGLGEDDVVSYEHVIKKFSDLNAVIVPVLWGKREKHGNALHILLPESNATWIYLNLDSNACDFNFWMAHELAHVYTQKLCGTEGGEDFADAFAGALLFSRPSAEALYGRIKDFSDAKKINAIKTEAGKRILSPITIWTELNKYAAAERLPSFADLPIYGAATNQAKLFPTITEHLFGLAEGQKPSAADYVNRTSDAFSTVFFDVVAKYLRDSAHGPGWVREVLMMPLSDAHALHAQLISA